MGKGDQCKLCGGTYLVKTTPVLLQFRYNGELSDSWTSINTCGFCNYTLQNTGG